MIFGQAPNQGDRFTIEGREINCLGSGPHTTKDERIITLIRWRSNCAQCGDEYEFKTPMDISRGGKRCRKCVAANPGWNSKREKMTPEEKKAKRYDRRVRNAKISTSLKAYHDRRLGRKEL